MQLTKKAFESNGKEIVVTLVKMGDTEGMFVTDVAAMLGTTAKNVANNMTLNNLSTQILGGQILDDAKEQGLVSKMVRSINLVPRDTVKALVKIVNTPEAWSAYNYLWEVAESPAVAVSHFKSTGRLAELESQLAAQQTELGMCPLTQEQVISIEKMCENHLRNLGINPMTSWLYIKESGASYETTAKGMIYYPLSQKFFGDRSPLNWRAIPRKHFNEIIYFIASWGPSEKQKEKLDRRGAMLPLTREQQQEKRAERDRQASAKSEALLAKRKAKREKDAAKPKRKYTKKVAV